MGEADVELILTGKRANPGQPTKARLRSGVVLRTRGPWSSAVLALLRHLEKVGFDHAPRVVESGVAEDGREMLTFVPGATPRVWSDEAAYELGQIVAKLHRATTSFTPASDALWHPSYLRDLPGGDLIISHCDAGPWNWIEQGGRPVALIDWEYAGPVDPLWDLAETVWLNAQLNHDDVAEHLGLSSVEGRARHARPMLEGYGLDPVLRRGLVSRMIEVAVYSARADAVEYGVTRETTRGVSDSGFPFLWGITWRVRSAAWMLTNRALLEAIVEA